MVIRRGNPNINKIALTFDDGPNPVYTEKILSILKEAGATATFFLIGHNAELYPDIVRKIQADGHDIGNHSYTHTKMDSVTEDVIKNEITRASAVIADITGNHPIYFRPPGGKLGKDHIVANVAGNLRLRTVMWSLECGDWVWPWETQSRNKLVIRRRARQIRNALSQNAKPGSIIDLHDGSEYFDIKNAEKRAIPVYCALPRLLKWFKENNLDPVKLSEMELIEESL